MATQNNPQKKKHWWNNIADVYRVTKRSYSWIGWAMLAALLSVPLIVLIICILVPFSVGRSIFYVIVGLSLGMLLATTLLTRLANSAMYKQLEGVKGNVYAVLRSIKRGWIVEQEPVAINRKQDLVYRLVGRPGIVLISEGPSSRVNELLNDQERKCHRVAPSVPIHKIQSGQGKNQVPIGKLLKTINRLKKEIGKDEVPIVGQRLQSLQNKAYRLPGGVDPAKAKMNRRMFRGK
ncbi:DUF4191 domain-containing protein [uncultured Varibaculum sp.]|uniref:DUF4191 domain-containing protein n=1 Tax=uncultured Varibaculum sp. TaxID=413896 RepID=UPI00259793E2|nr:DUF4191 domain-containing protein [uncultured Varibaculum sp.]